MRLYLYHEERDPEQEATDGGKPVERGELRGAVEHPTGRLPRDEQREGVSHAMNSGK